MHLHYMYLHYTYLHCMHIHCVCQNETLLQVVLDMLAEKFNEGMPAGEDVRSIPRAVGKLRKEAERVKDVLSANQQFQVSGSRPPSPSSPPHLSPFLILNHSHGPIPLLF